MSREYLMESAARGNMRAARRLRDLLLDELPAETQPPVAGQATRVVVGVCTSRRPSMLRHCLDAIALQIVPSHVELYVVVVDNEPEPNNHCLVQDHARRSPFPVHYIHQPVRGIPQSRNAALDVCLQLNADWIAFTDDDCWVSPAWIASLLNAATRYNADVVYGRRDFILPSTYWAVPPDQPTFEEGKRLRTAATHNVLFARWLIGEGRDGGLRFDERLAHGEDTDFFYRAVQRDARIVYSRMPVVFEIVPPERVTLRRQSSRAYYYAASRSYFHVRHRGALQAFGGVLDRVLLKGPAALVRLGFAPLVWPFDERAFKSLVLKGASRLAGVVGATAGLFGRPGNPYEAAD